MDDLISRQAAIDTLDKHLRTTDVPVSYPGIISALTEWLNELSSAQPDSKELSPTHKALDTISRQAAVDVLEERLQANGYSNVALVSEFNRSIGYLMRLPSAQPEDCDTCKHGYFGDSHCDNCRVRYPSHYERRTE